jgi:bacterioferritin
MGTKGREIVRININKLMGLLNKAYADEWLAYYQYWVSAKIAKGRMREAVIKELLEHADDELKHAGMLADRIIQLGGTPLTDFTKLNDEANCKYANPTNLDTAEILKQAIDGEQCAIDVYNTLLKTLKDKDALTYHTILEILEDEVEHEEDFQALLEDVESVMRRKA